MTRGGVIFMLIESTRRVTGWFMSESPGRHQSIAIGASNGESVEVDLPGVITTVGVDRAEAQQYVGSIVRQVIAKGWGLIAVSANDPVDLWLDIWSAATDSGRQNECHVLSPGGESLAEVALADAARSGAIVHIEVLADQLESFLARTAEALLSRSGHGLTHAQRPVVLVLDGVLDEATIPESFACLIRRCAQLNVTVFDSRADLSSGDRVMHDAAVCRVYRRVAHDSEAYRTLQEEAGSSLAAMPLPPALAFGEAIVHLFDSDHSKWDVTRVLLPAPQVVRPPLTPRPVNSLLKQ